MQTKHILMVDDDAMARRMFSLFMSKFPVTLTQASSGAEAVELGKTQAFDLIFIDHFMPEMDGIATLKALREILQNSMSGGALEQAFGTGDKTSPVMVALSAATSEQPLEEYRALGFDDFLSKPVEITKLKAILEKYGLLGE